MILHEMYLWRTSHSKHYLRRSNWNSVFKTRCYVWIYYIDLFFNNTIPNTAILKYFLPTNVMTKLIELFRSFAVENLLYLSSKLIKTIWYLNFFIILLFFVALVHNIRRKNFLKPMCADFELKSNYKFQHKLVNYI